MLDGQGEGAISASAGLGRQTGHLKEPINLLSVSDRSFTSLCIYKKKLREALHILQTQSITLDLENL